MKRKQIAILQIISVFVICLFVFLTVLYQKGYYDFTFIDRPSDNNGTENTTVYNMLEIFTPTFEFGDQIKVDSVPETTVPTATTTGDGQPEVLETESETEDETEETTEKETLPPLVFEPETTEKETESETTDTPEQTTGEGEETTAPETTGSPEQTTGPEETTSTPTEPETEKTPESTTGNETTTSVDSTPKQ